MPAQAGQDWLGALEEGMMLISLFLRGNPPSKKHHLGACLFPQLLSSCYPKFLATFILIFFPVSYFQPFLGFLKPVLLHHCCRQAWCVWLKADVCSKARAQALLVEAGRGLLAGSPCPERQAGLGLNTCSHISRNSWCQNRKKNPKNNQNYPDVLYTEGLIFCCYSGKGF